MKPLVRRFSGPFYRCPNCSYEIPLRPREPADDVVERCAALAFRVLNRESTPIVDFVRLTPGQRIAYRDMIRAVLEEAKR